MANQQYCLLLNPSLLTQSDFAAKSARIWLSLYKVEKVLTKSNYLIRKVGTPYNQCVHRIRLRPITPNYDVDDISVTTDDFRPDPSLGKFRSEHEIFDSALEQSFEDTSSHQTPATSQNIDDEVQHTIRGAIAGPAVAHPAPAGAPVHAAALPVFHGTGDAPLVPAPPEPEPDLDDLPCPEPNLDVARAQIHTDSPQSGVPAHETADGYRDENVPTSSVHIQRTGRRSRIPTKSPVTELKAKSQPSRIRFDKYDHFRQIPNRKLLTDGGFYAYLAQQMETPPTRNEKHEHLKSIAQSTRQLAQSKIPVPQGGRLPAKPILKHRYPNRSNRGQLGPSNDIYSAQFQFNMYDTPFTESIELPPNLTISEGDVFSDTAANFAHCVSSDLAMSAGIATHFLRIFPDLSELRKTDANLPPGSLIAHFNASSNNWIYNLVTKRHFFDKPTYFDLQKCLCRMKSHILQNNIHEIRLPQLECGLDKSEWKIVLMKLVTIFENTTFSVEIFLLGDSNSNSADNMLIAEEYSSDEETQRHVREMSKVRSLALKGMLKCPSTNDPNNRDTPH